MTTSPLHSLTTPRIRSILLASVLFLALQLSAEIPLGGALRLGAITLALALVGARLTNWALPNLHQISKVSLGTTLAVTLWTLGDQVLRPLGVRSVLTPLLLCAAIGLVVASFSRNKTKTQPVDTAVNHLDEVALLALYTLLLLSQTWSWLRWSSLVSAATVIAYLWARRRSLRSARLFLVVGFLFAVIGLSIGIVTRRTDWWLPGYGMDELEYLSNAAYQWGPAMDVLVANERIGYQWLGFATIGLFEHAGGVADFVIGTRFDFVFSAAVSAALVLAITYELVADRIQASIAALLACAMTTTMFYPNPWGLFVVNFRGFQSIALLGVVLASLGWIKHQFAAVSFIPLAVVSSALVAMKTAALVPIGVTLSVGVIFGLVRREWRIVLPLIGLGMFLVISTLLTIRGSSGMQFSIRQPFVFLDRFYGASFRTDRLASVSLGTLRMLAEGAALLTTLTVGAVAAAWWWAKQLRSWWVFALLGLPVLVGVFFATFTSRVSDTQMHFLQVPVTAMFMFLAVAGTYCLASVRDLPFIRNSFHFAIPASAAICVSVFALRSPFRIAGLEVALVREGVVLFNIVLATLLIAVLAQYLIPRTVHRLSMPVIVGGVVVFMAVVGVTNPLLLDRQGMYDSGIEEGVLGSPQLRDISQWLTENTSVTDVLASNMFAAEDTLLADSCAVSSEERNTLLSENLAKTNYFTLMMLSKRRFVVAAPHYASFTIGRPLVHEVRTSLMYGCEPNSKNRSALKRLGADWYVAYLPTTSPAFQAPDRIAYQSGSFFVIHLG